MTYLHQTTAKMCNWSS